MPYFQVALNPKEIYLAEILLAGHQQTSLTKHFVHVKCMLKAFIEIAQSVRSLHQWYETHTMSRINERPQLLKSFRVSIVFRSANF